MIILLFYFVEVHVVSLILFYIQICFEYIQITDHHNPHYLSIVTSCLAPNMIMHILRYTAIFPQLEI